MFLVMKMKKIVVMSDSHGYHQMCKQHFNKIQEFQQKILNKK